jgi:DNA polymerase-3 subunit alpha
MAEAAGVEPEKINELAKLIPQMIDTGMVGSDQEAYEQIADELGIDIHQDAAAIFDQVGGVSQHACAFVIGTRDRSLADWIPRFRIGSSNALVTQYNMKWVEELGFLKLDLLKLDTLSIMHNIARALGKDIRWLEEVAMPEPGIYEIDEDTAKLLREGRTEGVHSMQGSTQRRGCMEIGVETLEDLIVVQALYRPSGTRTGLADHYIQRRRGEEDWNEINEFVGRYTNETLGIAIYQEQIMDMAFGMGMSGEEVDDLYKAIKTAKSVGRGAKEMFEQFEATFRKHAKGQMPRSEADELWQEWEKLRGYTFNRGHATSYAILAAKSATIITHAMQQSYSSLMERYPGNPRYLAAAVREGFKFERPDVNVSSAGFSRGSDDESIRVGLLRVNGVGPGAANAIVRNQPFADVDDLVTRCGSQVIKQGEKLNTVQILADVGALESLGIERAKDDIRDFELLDFVPHRPKAFKGCKPSLGNRRNGKWQFLGLEKGVKITEGKAFCAKLFWIPSGAAVETKASATGQYHSHLLTAIDVNGIPFDLRCGTDKKIEAAMLTELSKCSGAVVCAEGQLAMPFLRGGNVSFKMWGITGAENGNPQAWHISKDTAKVLIGLAKSKAQSRR